MKKSYKIGPTYCSGNCIYAFINLEKGIIAETKYGTESTVKTFDIVYDIVKDMITLNVTCVSVVDMVSIGKEFEKRIDLKNLKKELNKKYIQNII